jgi:hypothetical protein
MTNNIERELETVLARLSDQEAARARYEEEYRQAGRRERRELLLTGADWRPPCSCPTCLRSILAMEPAGMCPDGRKLAPSWW